MKTKRLIVALVLTAAIIACALVGCTTKGGDVVVGLPDGAPTLAFAEIIAEQPKIAEGYTLKCEVVTADGSTEAPSIVGAKLLNGDYQMAVLPTNVAAKLYNGGAEIKIATVNTWGNLYMVSKGAALNSLEDLKGKIVYNISKSGVPNVVFTNLLNAYNIQWTDESDVAVENKVVIKYTAAQAMIVALKQGTAEYGILGEPAATRANANAGTTTVFDFQAAWAEKYGGSAGYPQAALVVRSDFYAANGAFVEALINKFSTNGDYLLLQENVDKTVARVAELAPATSLSGLKAATVSRCAVRALRAGECKEAVRTFLSAFNITVDDGFFA